MGKRNEGITDEMIINWYQDKVPTKDIAQRAGLTKNGVRLVLRRNGVEIRSLRKHPLNEDFFKEWSHEMAWVLGMIITDGNLHKDRAQVSITQKDIRVLEKISEYTSSAHKIRETNGSFRLTISSQVLKDDLTKLGLTPRKSLTVKFPNIPEEYLTSFIRGVFDGDGSVIRTGYWAHVASGSKEFSQGLYDTFTSWGLHTITRIIRGKNPTYIIEVSGKDDVLNLGKLIYLENPLDHNFLLYKRERMLQRINHP